MAGDIFGGAGRFTGRGATRPGSGPGGQCRCPRCGHTIFHRTGRPCFQERCSKCGATMIKA